MVLYRSLPLGSIFFALGPSETGLAPGILTGFIFCQYMIIKPSQYSCNYLTAVKFSLTITITKIGN